MVLGLTGGIACGKSTVGNMFRARGAAVVSADQLARDVVRPGAGILEKLVERFGAEILTAQGRLDRSALGGLVFADAAAREDLNRIVHPAIAALANERLAALRRQNLPLIVYEAPLLFEAGAEDRVDQVLVVRIDPATQLRRLMERDGLTEEDARARIDAQMPQEEKLARADFVVDNSSSLAATERQVASIFAALTDSRPPSP
jgi:dephospho-CoA kinase